MEKGLIPFTPHGRPGLFLREHRTWVCSTSRSFLYVLPILAHRVSNKHVLSGNSINFNHCFMSSQTFLSDTGLFFFSFFSLFYFIFYFLVSFFLSECTAVKIHRVLIQFDAAVLICTKACAVRIICHFLRPSAQIPAWERLILCKC